MAPCRGRPRGSPARGARYLWLLVILLASSPDEVEVREERPVGLITGFTYPVEVSFRLMKRPPLFQPNLDN